MEARFFNFCSRPSKPAPQVKGVAADYLQPLPESALGVAVFRLDCGCGIPSPTPVSVQMFRETPNPSFGDRGAQFEALAGATIRSVTTGILGVANPSVFATSFLMVGLPGAGL